MMHLIVEMLSKFKNNFQCAKVPENNAETKQSSHVKSVNLAFTMCDSASTLPMAKRLCRLADENLKKGYICTLCSVREHVHTLQQHS